MFTKSVAFIAKLKRYLVNSGWIMAERFLTLAATFVVTLVVARYLGPTKFGLLSYATSLAALFGIAGHAGLGGLVTRELVRHPDHVDEVLGTSFAIKILGYTLGLSLLVAFIFISEPLGSESFWVLLLLSASLLFKPFEIIDFWFTSKLQSKYNTYAKLSGTFAAGLLKIILVLLGANLLYFAAANLVQAMMISLMLAFIYQRKADVLLHKWKASLSRARELLSESWMIFLGSIFAVIYLKTDQVMLKWMVGNEEVGIYSVASTLSEAWYFVPVAIVTSFFPKLIDMQKVQDPRYAASMQQLYDILFMIALVIAVAVNLFAAPAINLLFGADYANAATILVIHIWAGLFIFMRAVFSKWILIEKLVVFSLVTQGLGALFNVAFNFYLIPRFGGEGAAYATLLSYAVASYFSLALHKNTRSAFVMMSKALLAPIRLPRQLLK